MKVIPHPFVFGIGIPAVDRARFVSQSVSATATLARASATFLVLAIPIVVIGTLQFPRIIILDHSLQRLSRKMLPIAAADTPYSLAIARRGIEDPAALIARTFSQVRTDMP
jgi:hypothetical protein